MGDTAGVSGSVGAGVGNSSCDAVVGSEEYLSDVESGDEDGGLVDAEGHGCGGGLDDGVSREELLDELMELREHKVWALKRIHEVLDKFRDTNQQNKVSMGLIVQTQRVGCNARVVVSLNAGMCESLCSVREGLRGSYGGGNGWGAACC
jgi:hypothetical protein